MSGTIATGGIQSDMDTASFNNVPKNSQSITVNDTYNYTQKNQYSQTFYDTTYQNSIGVVYTKYEGTTNRQQNQQIYGNIETYSYSYVEYDYDLGMNPPSSITWTLKKCKNITFYRIALYQGATDSAYNMYYTYDISTNDPITMYGELKLYEYSDYNTVNQYMNITNLENIRNYDPTNETKLLDTHNNILMLNNETTRDSNPYDFGSHIVGTITPQAFVIITESTNVSTLQYWGSLYDIHPGIAPKQLITSYNAVPFNYEVVDIPHIMLMILTLPFTFISQAFQPITLFPNTPYSLNIGNLILIILTTLIIIWIIKKVVKLR